MASVPTSGGGRGEAAAKNSNTSVLTRIYALGPRTELRIVTPLAGGGGKGNSSGGGVVDTGTSSSSSTTTASNVVSVQVVGEHHGKRPRDGDGVDETNQQQQVVEVFGFELAPKRQYRIQNGRSVALFCCPPQSSSTPNGDFVEVPRQQEQQVLVEVKAPPKLFNSIYCAPSATCMAFQKSIVDVHYFLQGLRKHAAKDHSAQAGGGGGSGGGVVNIGGGSGPRVLVCGSQSSCGKSTIVRTLANYAVRLNYHPIVCDLDTRMPSLGYPDCLNLYTLQAPIDPIEESTFVPGQHIFYGSKDLEKNFGLAKHCFKMLMDVAMLKMVRSPQTSLGGIYIDFPTLDLQAINEANWKDIVEAKKSAQGQKKDEGGVQNPLELLFDAIETFQVDTVIVVGCEALRAQIVRYGAAVSGYDPNSLQRVRSDPSFGTSSAKGVKFESLPLYTLRKGQGESAVNIKMISLESDSGATTWTEPEKEGMKKQRWLQYFIGTPSSPLHPTAIDIPLESFKLVSLGTVAAESMAGLLPMDEELNLEAANVTYVNPNDVQLSNRILALSDAVFRETVDAGDEEDEEGTQTGVDIVGGHQRMQKKDVPLMQFEEKVKRCHVLGFVMVIGITQTSIKVLSPCTTLPNQSDGLCFMLCESSM